MKKTKGGKRGYLAAVELGFEVCMHNPTIFYNQKKGFYVGSGLSNNNDYKVGLCFKHANSGKRSFLPKDYESIRESILNKEAS